MEEKGLQADPRYNQLVTIANRVRTNQGGMGGSPIPHSPGGRNTPQMAPSAMGDSLGSPMGQPSPQSLGSPLPPAGMQNTSMPPGSQGYMSQGSIQSGSGGFHPGPGTMPLPDGVGHGYMGQPGHTAPGNVQHMVGQISSGNPSMMNQGGGKGMPYGGPPGPGNNNPHSMSQSGPVNGPYGSHPGMQQGQTGPATIHHNTSMGGPGMVGQPSSHMGNQGMGTEQGSCSNVSSSQDDQFSGMVACSHL